MLPFALRQHYLQYGYCVVPGHHIFNTANETGVQPPPSTVSASAVEHLRLLVLQATNARSKEFLSLPTMESILKSATKLTDPTYERMLRRMKQYQENRARRQRLRRKYLRLKRKHAANTPTRVSGGASGEDVWRLTQAVLEELESLKRSENCGSTIANDPQLLKAIEEYRVNLWMTDRGIEAAIRGELGKALGRVAQEVAGVDSPVLFSDSPIARPAFGRPVLFHISAPTIGVSFDAPTSAATTLLVFTHAASCTSMQPFIIRSSRDRVRSQLWGPTRCVDPTKLELRFSPLESHIPHMTQHFRLGDDAVSEPLTGVMPGDTIVLDPHTMIGFGPNLSGDSNVVYRANVVSRSSTPSLQCLSWLVGWRSSPSRVKFSADVVFPRLY